MKDQTSKVGNSSNYENSNLEWQRKTNKDVALAGLFLSIVIALLSFCVGSFMKVPQLQSFFSFIAQSACVLSVILLLMYVFTKIQIKRHHKAVE